MEKGVVRGPRNEPEDEQIEHFSLVANQFVICQNLNDLP